MSIDCKPLVMSGSDLDPFDLKSGIVTTDNVKYILTQVVTDVCKLNIQVGLSQMRSHTASCSKYQEYIDEGVRTSAQNQPAIIR